MATFNELLRASGINPREVVLLRHSGRNKRTGKSPYGVWSAKDGQFDRYQSTQPPSRFFEESKYWASFIATPERETLFLGLYKPTKADRAAISWLCPVSDLPPGQDKGRESDLYSLELSEALGPLRETLRVDWGSSYRRWNQYAHDNDKLLLDDVDETLFSEFAESEEGERVWREHLVIERDRRLSAAAFELNLTTNMGSFACDACDFRHPDRSMFDAHHPTPLLCGPITTRARDLLILCPTCHRRAHRSSNRMLPFGLASLRQWAADGRP